MSATDRAIELAKAAATAAVEKSATKIIAFDVSEQLYITDIFVICTAASQPQARAIQDAVEERLHDLGAKPVRREGAREGRWVLLDYFELVVHIQNEEERAFYALERLWSDCPVVDLR